MGAVWLVYAMLSLAFCDANVELKELEVTVYLRNSILGNLIG